jgi:hypothetical protein
VKPGVDERARCLLGLRIAVERYQSSLRAEAREDRAAVPAASERAVDIDSVGPDRERLRRLVLQHRLMHDRRSQ